MNLPVIPDPTTTTVASLQRACTDVLAWIEQCDDIDAGKEMLDRLLAVEEYLARRDAEAPAQEAARWLEVRIGELLGKATVGAHWSANQGRALTPTERKYFRQLAAHPKIVAEMVPTSRRAILQMIRRRQQHRLDAFARQIEPGGHDRAGDGWMLLAGDTDLRLAEIPDGSIDMIVTDPPYPAESLPLWSVLARHAARVLVPQGILVALTGKIMWPDVIARLGEHLQYGWSYCQPLPGPSSRILARHVGQEWKPWLAYSNGPWPSGRIDWHGDMLHGVPQMKDRYHWEQSEQPAGELIVRLSPDDAVVLDPFCGTGTYGIAARRAGRRFVGIDGDAGRVASAAERLAA